MAKNEVADSRIYSWLCCVSTGKSRASNASKTFTTVINTLMELGGYYHGFYVGITERKEMEWCYLGILDRLTKSALFLPMKMIDSMDKLAKLYVNEVVRLYGVPVFIMSDREFKFTSQLWPNI